MKLDLPYGTGKIAVHIPDDSCIAWPKKAPPLLNLENDIREAVHNPIGTPRLREIARGKKDAVIVINDATRPAPTEPMLTSILEELKSAGISDKDVSVVIACGNHRPATPDEIRSIVGNEFAEKLKILNHVATDTKNMVLVGKTKVGTPVWINSAVAHASIKILTGLIAPHHSAGYSGGRKSLVPGVAGIETIKAHHSFPIRQFEPMCGKLAGNPFHEEAVRIARLVGIDFIVNVVQDGYGTYVGVVAGDVEKAHEAGIAMGSKYWNIDLQHKFPIVIATPGGYPRDIDLHQAQKALSTAEMAAVPGSVLVLIAECREGLGKWKASWLREATHPRDVIRRFEHEGFTEGHTSKDFMLARALCSHQIIIFSSLSPDIVRNLFMTPASSPQQAIDEALKLKPMGPVLVLPKAVNLIPRVKK
ncbi:nickel-dependent lactate racemase [Thermodesulforhabdus norvegica]|uniref:Nickel-dependent lactate racemase n=1 Tax=Thermodesulforhabdus norvegica TaxID=39841 RepID=A0A1I4QFQ1_9BACT|nr:nickel-dependent lactate racemase [Thermodesulforhabdus norvegica]SFM38854.1 Nickel-dependent lactate racemase [Thermodesulforhabdus norvegica]